MGPSNPKTHMVASALTLCLLLLCSCTGFLFAQQPAPSAPAAQPSVQPSAQPSAQAPTPLPNAPDTGTVTGTVTDTTGAFIPNAHVALTLLAPATHAPLLTTTTDGDGAFTLAPVPAGSYRIRILAPGFSPWRLDNIQVRPAENVNLSSVELGIEPINSVVEAITIQNLAEEQITAEEHQRILGVLPNFFVSYIPNAAPLTVRQKFKLAFVVSHDPLTFITTGITAGIEQANGDFAGYGPGWSGYAQRYAATYGDRLSATFLGSAVLPSLLHQDPRYFYLGHGSILHRALYAISTTVICKGDNGHWQPNYSNVLGNLGSAGISTLYYPQGDRHSAQVTVVNTLIGVAYGAVGTLFQEFLLRHLTHGAPHRPTPLP